VTAEAVLLERQLFDLCLLRVNWKVLSLRLSAIAYDPFYRMLLSQPFHRSLSRGPTAHKVRFTDTKSAAFQTHAFHRSL
jgi:hypothetical protein